MNIRVKEQLESYFSKTSEKKEVDPIRFRLKKLIKYRSSVGTNIKMCLGGEWVHKHSIMKFVHSEPFPDLSLNRLSIVLNNHKQTGLRLSDMVFLDIETTGNNMGVGTLVFLIGFCYISGDTLIAEQYLLTSIDSEDMLLRIIRDKLSRFNIYASYNGRSFDIPFLMGRYRYHRIEQPETKLHIDLYHLTRRIFASPGGYRLCEIENYLLRRVRDVDISSNLVPHAFFRFIKSGDTHSLRLAILHNRYDIITLPLLLTRLEHMVSFPRELFGAGTLYKIGRMYFSLKEYTKAEEYLRLALKTGDIEQKIGVLRLLGRIFKRQRRYKDAVESWLKIIEEIESDPEANKELAMIYEHRIKDFERAYHFASRLKSDLEDAQRRLSRLVKKLKSYPSHHGDSMTLI